MVKGGPCYLGGSDELTKSQSRIFKEDLCKADKEEKADLKVYICL
jgi:hypothetical protein